MAIVFLPLNGIGLGHVSRAFALAQAMQTGGESPVIFAQGLFPDFMANVLPGISVGTIYKAAEEQRRSIAHEIQTYARRTHPAVVIEDTHPAPLEFASDICRLLLVCPKTIDFMRKLRSEYAGAFHRFLIVDHPDSPTWPYRREETREIEAWSGWSCIGPAIPHANAPAQDLLRRKYSLKNGIPVYVFTMGGGGVQESAERDIGDFFEFAAKAAECIRKREPASRLIFIRGPLFPATVSVPPLFEDYSIESEMPSLFGLAAGVVARHGFNTIWECLLARTPFVAFEGHTFAEPVSDRRNQLAAAGLLPQDSEQWLDKDWIEGFKRTCDSFVQRWTVEDAVKVVLSCIAQPPNSAAKIQKSFPQRMAKSHPLGSEAKPTVLIRVDDVTEASEELITIFRLCGVRELSLSLEVIPYLCRLDDASLRDLTAGGPEIEVSQHGYDHLPRRAEDGCKAEFIEGENFSLALEKGRQIIQRLFPTTFRGGFSAPFDVFPFGLCRSWEKLGGRYVSTVWAQPRETDLPLVRLGTDPWEWRQNKPHSIRHTIKEMKKSLEQKGYAGLVLHPQLLKIRGQVRHLEKLLNKVVGLKCRSVLISAAILKN